MPQVIASHTKSSTGLKIEQCAQISCTRHACMHRCMPGAAIARNIQDKIKIARAGKTNSNMISFSLNSIHEMQCAITARLPACEHTDLLGVFRFLNLRRGVQESLWEQLQQSAGTGGRVRACWRCLEIRWRGALGRSSRRRQGK
jgi:hypothetical protein